MNLQPNKYNRSWYGNLKNYKNTDNAILLIELWQNSLQGSNSANGIPYNTHNQGRNVLYVDGHVKMLTKNNSFSLTGKYYSLNSDGIGYYVSDALANIY